jgi:hypothetical protein
MREARATVRNVKPDSLHPGSQSCLVYQGSIPNLDRPPLVATVLHHLVIFAFTNFPLAAIFTACNITHGAMSLGH